MTRVALSFLGSMLLTVPVAAIAVTAAASPVSAEESALPGQPAETLNAVQEGTVLDLTGPPPVAAWPLPGYSLWIPPRQGALVFAEPVDASTFVISLEDSVGPASQLSRLTKGVSRTVAFAFPVLEGPAELALSYAGSDGSGQQLAGAIAFSLETPFAASGGGNHRHASDAVHQDQPELVILRAMFVWSAALTMLSAWRSRRGRRAFSELVIPRLAGLLLAAAALWQAGILLSGAVEEYPDSPFTAVVSSAGLWLFLPLACGGLLQVIAGRRDAAAAAVSAVALLSVVASTSHSSGVWGALQSVTYAVLLVLAAALGAGLIELGSRLWSRGGPSARPAALRIAVLSAVVAVLSVGMVVLHAHGFSVNGDFADDLASRVVAATALLLAIGGVVLVSPCPGRALARVASVPLLVVAGAAMTYLLWLPPPTSGL